MYAGEDKFEKFNRKMFNLNSRLNKYIARPAHILWASVMPKFGMDRIRDVYNNIEYPKRLASCILQWDGQGIKTETLRFLTNTTLGLGGLFDPADRILKIKPTNENMEQALCKCKMHSGSYFVMPVLNSCTPRSLCGRALEAALDPGLKPEDAARLFKYDSVMGGNQVKIISWYDNEMGYSTRLAETTKMVASKL